MTTRRLKKFLQRVGLVQVPDPADFENVQKVFLIGAMKCGTNSLYHNLKRHPQIVVPKTKELDFFLTENNPDQYLANFKFQKNTLATLDGTTQYSKHPSIPFSAAKIARTFPEAKIVYNMRDPISRLESQVAHHIARNEKITLDNWRNHDLFNRAVHIGRYYSQIAQYAVEFPRTQIFLGIFEDMISDQNGYAGKICDFIGVDAGLLGVEEHQRNKRRDTNDADKLRFSPRENREYAALFKDDIDCLVETFGVDTSRWQRYHSALEG